MQNSAQYDITFHSEYPRSLKNRDMASLEYIIQDCENAIKAMPDNPKCGRYADEISYCRAEINARTPVSKSKLLKDFCRKNGLKVTELPFNQITVEV